MAVGKMSFPFPLRWDMDLVTEFPARYIIFWNPGSLIQQQQQQQQPTKHLPRNSTSNLLFLNESDIVAGIDGITFILYLPNFFQQLFGLLQRIQSSVLRFETDRFRELVTVLFFPKIADCSYGGGSFSSLPEINKKDHSQLSNLVPNKIAWQPWCVSE